MAHNKVSQQLSRNYYSQTKQQRNAADHNDRLIRSMLQQAQGHAAQAPLMPEIAAAERTIAEHVDTYVRSGRGNASVGVKAAVAALLVTGAAAQQTMGSWATTMPYTMPMDRERSRIERMSSKLAAHKAANPVPQPRSLVSQSTAPTRGNPSLVPAPLGGCVAPNHIPTIDVRVGGQTSDVRVGGQTINHYLDTGSSDQILAGPDCYGCGVDGQAYQPGPTAQDLGRQGEVNYGSGSVGGEMFQDDVAADGAPVTARANVMSVDSDFGLWQQPVQNCSALDEQLPDPSSALLGIGPQAAAGNSGVSYNGLLAKQGFPNVFAINLGDQIGSITWGGFNPSLAAAPVQYTSMTVPQLWYYINVQDLAVGGESTQTSWTDMIPDTGTNALYLPGNAFNAIVSRLAPQVGPLLGEGFFASPWTCVGLQENITAAHLDGELDGITLQLEPLDGQTATLDLKPSESYLAVGPTTTGTQVCNILADGDAFGMSIWGSPGMRAHLLVFDVDAGRLGVAPLADSNGTAGVQSFPPPLASGGSTSLGLVIGASLGASIGTVLLGAVAVMCCKSRRNSEAVLPN